MPNLFRLFYNSRAFLLCCFFVFPSCLFAFALADSINQKVQIKLTELANTGYPFAQISPEITQENGEIKVELHVEKGHFVGDLRPRFITDGNLREHLVRKPVEHFFADSANFYNHKKIEAAISVLQSRRYVRNAAFFAPEISASGDFYELPIKVLGHNSVFFSGGAGISTHPKTSVVGNANFNIVNPLGFGEVFDFSYIGEETFYRISGDLQIPYFLATPFGIVLSANAEIGENYGSILLSAGAQYFFGGFWTAGLLGVYSELSQEDSVSRYSGIRAVLENTKTRLQKGRRSAHFAFEVESGVIHNQNERLPKADILANTEFHIPFGTSRFAYLTSPRLGIIAYSMPQDLHETQVFRLGGANSVRGYQESVFSAVAFGSLGNEFRFYMDSFSALYLLADYAAMQKNGYSLSQTEHILGYGAGISLPLRNVVFSLEWARHIRDFSDFGRLHFRFSTF
jgi:outer membrane protein assembly factor BamA